MEVFFEKMSLTFKSPDVIRHWYIHTPTQGEQTKKLTEIHFKVTHHAFTKKKNPKAPQKADWVYKCIFKFAHKIQW